MAYNSKSDEYEQPESKITYKNSEEKNKSKPVSSKLPLLKTVFSADVTMEKWQKLKVVGPSWREQVIRSLTF